LRDTEKFGEIVGAQPPRALDKYVICLRTDTAESQHSEPRDFAHERANRARGLCPQRQAKSGVLAEFAREARKAGSMASVGMVGIGEMGGAFVERLLEAGQTVVGWNRTREKIEPLIARGMRPAKSPADVARQSDVLLTMLTNGAALTALSDGADGILAGIRGKVLVEVSTISPDDVVALQARVAAAGGELVDASVLGSPLTVRQGKLVVMVAGDDAAIAKARPILEIIGPRVVAMGEIGKAKIMKIALNLNLPAQILALSEGLLLAVRSGIERSRALEVMLAGAMASPMLQYRAPFIEEMPAKAWFDVGMMQKDCDLALTLGRELGVPLFSTAVSREMLSAARGQGLGERDFAIMYYALANAAGLRETPPVAEPPGAASTG
jgi:3-hydroxyisobutyrate dehydrogenase-like beta-hydroxyacid dehydrogenase